MTNARLQKARWRSRRGMRELDVLLTRYIDAHFEQLSPPAADQFERLLEESDVDLYAWLTGRSIPSDTVYVELIADIRACKA